MSTQLHKSLWLYESGMHLHNGMCSAGTGSVQLATAGVAHGAVVPLVGSGPAYWASAAAFTGRRAATPSSRPVNMAESKACNDMDLASVLRPGFIDALHAARSTGQSRQGERASMGSGEQPRAHQPLEFGGGVGAQAEAGV